MERFNILWKKFKALDLAIKIPLCGFIFIPTIACLAFLLDGTPYSSLVSILFVIGWCAFAFFILKSIYLMIKGWFE
jgi:hypothetical protein